MRKIATLLILAILSFPALSGIEERMSLFGRQLDLFQKVCFVNGEFQSSAFWDSKTKDTYIDCNIQAVTLNDEREAIEREMQKIGGEACEQEIASPELKAFLAGTSSVVNSLNCPGMDDLMSVEGASSCVGKIACNLGLSIVPDQIREHVLAKIPGVPRCVQNKSCAAQIGQGIKNSIFGLLGFVWDGVKWAAGSLGCSALNLVYVIDACKPDPQVASDNELNADAKAAGASQMDDKEVAQYKFDPVGWVASKLSQFGSYIVNSIRESFACQAFKPDGSCATPGSELTWDCTDCDQKLDMVCGTVGFIGAELIVAFFTGATVRGAKIGSELLGITGAVSKARNTKAGAVIAEGAVKFGSWAGGKLGKAWEGISNSRFAKGLSTINAIAREKIALSVNGRKIGIYSGAVDTIAGAARKFNELQEAAFKAGYQLGGKAQTTSRESYMNTMPLLSQFKKGATGKTRDGRIIKIESQQDYLNYIRSQAKPEDRRFLDLVVTNDKPPRALIVDRRAGNFGSGVVVAPLDGVGAPVPFPAPVIKPVSPVAASADEAADLTVTEIIVSGGGKSLATRSSEVARRIGRGNANTDELFESMDFQRAPDSPPGTVVYRSEDGGEIILPAGKHSLTDAQRSEIANVLTKGRGAKFVHPDATTTAIAPAGSVAAGKISDITPPGVKPPESGGIVVQTGRVDGFTPGKSLADNSVSGVSSSGPGPAGRAEEGVITDITTGSVKAPSTKGQDLLSEIGGAGSSFRDREIILDVLSNGPRKAEYLRPGSRFSDEFKAAYRRIEKDLKNRPNFEDLKKRAAAFTKDRVDEGNLRTADEIGQIKKQKLPIKDENFDCKNLARVMPGAFPETGGKCKKLTFEDDVNGRYCSCGAKGKKNFNWLVACPTSTTGYTGLQTYVDEIALPHDSAPEMCARVKIPKGKECYLGPTSATFAGFGGTTQILCQTRGPKDPGATASKAELENYQAQLDDVKKYKLQFGPPELEPIRWSPFSDFPEYQAIVQRASNCTTKCDPATLAKIQQDFEAATAAIRVRGNPKELERLTAETDLFNQYIKELGEGRKRFPTSSDLSPNLAAPVAPLPLSTISEAPVLRPGFSSAGGVTTAGSVTLSGGKRAQNIQRATDIAARRGETLEEAVKRNTSLPDTPSGLAERRRLIAEDFPGLTPAQLDGLVYDVHKKIGAESILAGKPYSKEDLLAKQKRMDQLGVSREDADALLRLGYTGSSPNPIVSSLDPAMVRALNEDGLEQFGTIGTRINDLESKLKYATDPATIRSLEAQIITEQRKKGLSYAVAAEKSSTFQEIRGSIDSFAAAGDVNSASAMVKAAIQKGASPAKIRESLEARITVLQGRRVPGKSNTLIDTEILTLKDTIARIPGSSPGGPRGLAAADAPVPPPAMSEIPLNSAQLQSRAETSVAKAQDLRKQLDTPGGATPENLSQYQMQMRSAAEDLEASARLSKSTDQLRNAASKFAEAGDVNKAAALLEEAIQLKVKSGGSFDGAARAVLDENAKRMKDLYREIPVQPSSSSATLLRQETELENLRAVNKALAEKLSVNGRKISAPTEPPPTRWAVAKTPPDVAAQRAKELAAAKQFESASFYHQRAIVSRNRSDVNYTSSLNTSIKGSGNVLEQEFKFVQDPRNGVLPQEFITTLYKTDWRMVANPQTKAKLHKLLKEFQTNQKKIGSVFTGNTVERRNLEEMIQRTSK